jgi:hypothetical protein
VNLVLLVSHYCWYCFYVVLVVQLVTLSTLLLTLSTTTTNYYYNASLQVLLASGKTVPLTPAFRQQLEAKFGDMAVRPLRCLAFALKDGKDLGDLAVFGEVQYLQALEFALKKSLMCKRVCDCESSVRR